MYEWQLDDLYPGFDSFEFQSDLDKFATIKETFKKLTLEDSIESIRQSIHWLEQYRELVGGLYAYVNLNLAVNTTHPEATKYRNRLTEISASMAKEMAKINRFLGTVTTDISKDDYLSKYQFFFIEAKESASHLLSDEVEEVIALMKRSASMAWETLHGYVTSKVEADFNGEQKTLSEIRNLAYDANKEVRRQAYEAELAMSASIEDSVAFALNNIKSQVNDIARLRGFESPLAQTLADSRMSRQTLDALLGAIKATLPAFRRYLKRKANLLGYQDGLPFYELFAPIGEVDRYYSVEEAREYLVSIFADFSQDLADMTEEAFDKRYIDFFPRKGKRGGAFCHNLPFIKQSRVMMNYDGSLNNLTTLAHELGHAYHGLHIQDHLPLNRSYSMPVAETASIFNEAIVMNDLLSHTQTAAEKIAIIEPLLQDVTQIIVDIYSRYLFETAVFEQRQSNFLFPEQLKTIMLESQKTAYGDGLDPSFLHPYMWLNKPHYYSGGLSFYNFPYAFGGLFSRGLYAKYQENPEGFVEQYQALLRATTVSSVEDAAKVMEVDVTEQAFWQSALDGIVTMIDEFITLTNE